MQRPLTSLFFCLLMIGCIPESKRVFTDINIDPKDPVQKRILDHMVVQNRDSLVSFFDHPDPTYRYLAARSFASYQEERALDSLYSLLDDPVVKVRSMASYAIGQIASIKSEEELIKNFRQKDTLTVDNLGNANILLALGKLSSAPMAKFISSADGYRQIDTLLIEGQMQSLYQFGFRGIQGEEMIERALGVVKDPGFSEKSRLYAAHFLARTKDLDTEKIKFQLAEAFVIEESVNVKMALAYALRHALTQRYTISFYRNWTLSKTTV